MSGGCGVQVNLINGTNNISSRLPLIKTTMWIERILCVYFVHYLLLEQEIMQIMNVYHILRYMFM